MNRPDIPPDGVREIDHSGDVGLEVWGETREALLANATRGLCGLMTWSRIDPVVSRPIEVRAANPGDLVVDWLSAVITATATYAEIYAGATVESADDFVATGVLHGAPLDAARHQLRFDVKAATYHELLVEHTPGGYHARVIFDL
jgi:SHS2 domain-containing protein